MDQLLHDQLYDAAKSGRDSAALVSLLPTIPFEDPRRAAKLNCCAWNALQQATRIVPTADILNAFREARSLDVPFSRNWWKVSLNYLVAINATGRPNFAQEIAEELLQQEENLPDEVAEWRWYLYSQLALSASMQGDHRTALRYRQMALPWSRAVNRETITLAAISAGVARCGDTDAARFCLPQVPGDVGQAGILHWAKAVIAAQDGDWSEADSEAAAAIPDMRQGAEGYMLLLCVAEAHLIRAQAALRAGDRVNSALHAITAFHLAGGVGGNWIADSAASITQVDGGVTSV